MLLCNLQAWIIAESGYSFNIIPVSSILHKCNCVCVHMHECVCLHVMCTHACMGETHTITAHVYKFAIAWYKAG